MALSRYRNCYLIDGHKLSIPKINFEFTDDDVYLYYVGKNDRLDVLAREDFGADAYWFILARINNISFMFDIDGMTTIKRPRNPLLFLNQL